jgi:CRP-like cAMP-binding protein
MIHFTSIRRHPLFYGITEEEATSLLSCFCFTEKYYTKDTYIILEGDLVQSIGIILQGKMIMEKNDLYGNNYFLTELRENQIFGDTFMNHFIQPSSVNYKAVTDCSVLFFQYKHLWHFCDKHCHAHAVFSENLMFLLAEKTRSLLAKIEILSKKSLRDKILTFLYLLQANQNITGFQDKTPDPSLNSNQVLLPFNQTELAEYLGVNRSALSRELKKMKEEHLIYYEKRLYTIYEKQNIPDSV